MYLLMGLFRTAWLVILPAVARAETFLPCAAGTSMLTVESAENAVTLASSLKCSNGTFVVDWVGDVVVSETISVAQGTSLNITGSPLGAAADGNHTTGIFSVGSGSALHLKDMILKNGHTNAGAAVSATSHSRVTFSGNMDFTANNATRGGAIYLNSSTAYWNGGFTTFRSNSASEYGGAIMACNSTAISWDGDTSFIRNIGAIRGGGVYVDDYSKVSWSGTTTFVNNFADDGGGLYMRDNCVGIWNGTTKFAGNTAVGTGGGLDVNSYSKVSWTGVTTFTGNSADRAGALWVWRSAVSWNGNTTFGENVAYTDGGAVYATLNHNITCRGTTIFSNNIARHGNGGALGLYGSLSSEGSSVNIAGDTKFTNNSASSSGGAIFSAANPHGQYFEKVEFMFNTARVGGAVATFGTGNADECALSPTMFLMCRFFGNNASETGGAMDTAFGQEEIVSSDFESNFADVGGALRLGGNTTIRECHFVSNLASRSGPAIGAVGMTAISDSHFKGNTFFCQEKKFLRENPTGITARYETVCDGCPSWGDCHSCDVSEPELEPICDFAMAHTTSDEPGNTLNTLSVNEGYWRAIPDTDNILPCYNVAACGGGRTGTETFCGDGYTGAYCSVCESGYSPSLPYTCTRCSESRRQSLVVIASMALIVAFCALGALSTYLVSTNVGDAGKTCVHPGFFRAVPLQASKNVIIVWQILTQFASVANITYPAVYKTFLNGIDAINLDIAFIASAGCLWHGIDFHDRLLAITIWPLAVLGLMVVTYTVALRRKSACCEMVREKILNKHLSAMLLLLFFVYSSVSSTVFRMFACDDVDDGHTYLRADYRIKCTDAKHRLLQAYAAVMIAVYPVGIPLLYAVLLFRYRRVLSDDRANKSNAQPIANLWAPYRPSVFYYEVIECGRRIMLTGVAVFIFPNSAAQVAITVMNSLFFFVVSEVLSPYVCASDTWLSRGGQVIILFSMYDALLLKVNVSNERSDSQGALGVVMVVGHVILVTAVVVETLCICRAARRKSQVVEEQNPFEIELKVRSVRSTKPQEQEV